MDDGLLDELKIRLAEELGRPASEFSFDAVLSMANEISKLDQNNVRFSIDSSHVSRLGNELVSKQETAVAELIKNSYDADAVEVKVYFVGTSRPGGRLIIEDTGLGMSRQQLIDGFMRISTKDKSDHPLSTKFKRQRAGRKGIGRFSAQRLGRELEITTRREEDFDGLKVEIDWSKFDQAKDLILVTNQVSFIPKAVHGTTLSINNLKDSWSSAQIQRAYRYITELLQPFPLDASRENKGRDPGFKVEFYQEINGEMCLVADERSNVFDAARAVIEGHVDEKGVAYFSLTSTQHKISIRDEVLIPDERVKGVLENPVHGYDLLKGVRFKAYYFIDENMPAGKRTTIRNILNRYGGVRVYRNGFRVLPYGETKDDWLGLQRSSALRQVLPPHHNSNFLGFVEITDVEGRQFEETSSREGLIENDAFTQLQNFVYKSLIHGVIKVAHARERKIFAGDEPKNKPSEQAKSLVNEMNSLLDSLVNDSSERNSEASDAELEGRPTNHEPKSVVIAEAAGIGHVVKSEQWSHLAKKIESLGAVSEAIMHENGMLRVLASLGLTIGEFTHETRHTLAALMADVRALPAESSGHIAENIDALQSYMRYFDMAVTQNSQRNLAVHELSDLVADFEKVVASTLKRQHIDFSSEVRDYDLFVKASHKSEWISILINLFTNSLKAIKRQRVKGKIKIVVGEMDEETLYLEFMDNGDGILVENRQKVFDAFYTTSTPADALATDETQVTGSGLGLKIVKDMLDDAEADIFVVEPPEHYSTCFRIEFPRAAAEDIPDELY